MRDDNLGEKSPEEGHVQTPCLYIRAGTDPERGSG